MSKPTLSALAAFLLAAATPLPSTGQALRTPGAIEAGLILRQADGVKRVMMVAAHPDDEDSGLLATLARGWGAETAYFAFTRGEGGQDLIGPELGEGLGLIRTGELLAARSIDGASQFFSRAYDFGFSKTAQESFAHWPRELLLSDLVWAIRKFRPQVIVSIFSGTPRDGHGQHQVAGILTREAWTAAGDPTRFPEQIAAGLQPWTPLKLYRRTFFDPQNATLEVQTGTLDPLLGRSYHQLAMDGRSHHRSQDFGSPQSPGPRSTHLLLVDTRVASSDSDPLMTGVDTTLATLSRPLGPDGAREAAGYRAALAEARGLLNAVDPESALASLAAAARHIDTLSRLAATEAPPGVRRELSRRRVLIDRALLALAGVRVQLRSRDDILVPGESVLVEARVWSGRGTAISLNPPILSAPQGWRVSPWPAGVETPPDETGAFGRFFAREEEVAPPGVPATIEPGQMALWRYQVRVPADLEPRGPYFLERPRDGDLYRWPDSPESWTLPFEAPPLYGTTRVMMTVGGQKIEVESRAPVRYRGVDKAKGEFWRPIELAPRVSVTAEAGTMIWSTDDSAGREVGFHLTNLDPAGIAGSLSLEVPEGWRVAPSSAPFDLATVGADARTVFTVTPPAAAKEGEFFLRPMVATRPRVTTH